MKTMNYARHSMHLEKKIHFFVSPCGTWTGHVHKTALRTRKQQSCQFMSASAVASAPLGKTHQQRNQKKPRKCRPSDSKKGRQQATKRRRLTRYINP